MSDERKDYRSGDNTYQRPGMGPGFGPGRGPGRGGFGSGPIGGMPVEKAKNFKGTLKRLFRIYFKPQSFRFLIVIFMAILSTIFNIVSPKIMGKATTKLFEGVMLKLKGIPGAQIDFAYIL